VDGRLAAQRRRSEGGAEHLRHGLALRQVDPGAEAGAPARDQRQHHRARGGDPADRIAVRDPRLVRHAVVAVAGGRGHSRHLLDDRPEADEALLGPGLAEPGHADQDHVGPRLAQHLVADAKLVEHVGAVVLDHAVALRDQLQEQSASARLRQVESQ